MKINHLCCRRGTRAKYARLRNDEADRLCFPNLMEELCDPNRQQKKCQQAQNRMRAQQTNIEKGKRNRAGWYSTPVIA
jgi:hypothetical protein